MNKKIYLFGISRNLEDVEVVEFVPPYIIMPTSTFKSYWNIVNIILLIYTAIYMPYRISFIDQTLLFQSVIDWAVDALFSFDILVTLFSAYEEEDGAIQTNFRVIVMSYVQSWFFLDIVVW